jgi:hypothetical protein
MFVGYNQAAFICDDSYFFFIIIKLKSRKKRNERKKNISSKLNRVTNIKKIYLSFGY